MKARSQEVTEYPALGDEESIEILETKENNGKVHLKVILSPRFHDDFYKFLSEKGFLCYGHEKPGIALIVSFGLNINNRDEMAKDMSEMENAMSDYAATRFRVYECYEETSKIASGLRLMLAQNKSLKRKLMENGLGQYVSIKK
jgi:hypothetical protein